MLPRQSQNCAFLSEFSHFEAFYSRSFSFISAVLETCRLVDFIDVPRQRLRKASNVVQPFPFHSLLQKYLYVLRIWGRVVKNPVCGYIN